MIQFKTRGVDDDEDDASVTDVEDSDDESDGGVYPGIKQETIKVEDIPEDDDENNRVGSPQVKIIRVECKMDRIKNQFAGAGHSTKRGVIKL